MRRDCWHPEPSLERSKDGKDWAWCWSCNQNVDYRPKLKGWYTPDEYRELVGRMLEGSDVSV